MGRTLYYGVIGKIRVTEEQKDKLIVLTDRYQRKYEWTYEKVWFLLYIFH
jgi:hypothetical protein